MLFLIEWWLVVVNVIVNMFLLNVFLFEMVVRLGFSLAYVSGASDFDLEQVVEASSSGSGQHPTADS